MRFPLYAVLASAAAFRHTRFSGCALSIVKCRRTTRPSLCDRPPPLKALVALNAATVIWGSQHPVMKDLVESVDPASVNAARFTIAAAFALPWLPGAPWRSQSEHAGGSKHVMRTWLAGSELGAYTFLGFALQSFGLQFTTASRSAFLLYLNVKLVPVTAHSTHLSVLCLPHMLCTRSLARPSTRPTAWLPDRTLDRILVFACSSLPSSCMAAALRLARGCPLCSPLWVPHCYPTTAGRRM